MKITKATQADLKAIVGLNKQFHLNTPGFMWDKKAWVSEEIEAGNFHVLKNHNSTYGAVCIHTDLSGLLKSNAYIETIAVRKDMHGNGLGKQLIDFAKDKAKKEGKERLVIHSQCLFERQD